jgi:hypothetical protein
VPSCVSGNSPAAAIPGARGNGKGLFRNSAASGERGGGKVGRGPCPRSALQRPASVSSRYCAFCAWNRHASRCDVRCAPASRGCRRRQRGRQSAHAIVQPELRGQDRGTSLIAVLTDVAKVASFGFRERSHGPIVDHQYINAAESSARARARSRNRAAARMKNAEYPSR